MTMKWTRTAFGWAAHDGLCRWTIRGPVMGKPMFWLYRDGSRFTPTGRYDDVVSFTTAREAKAKVADYHQRDIASTLIANMPKLPDIRKAVIDAMAARKQTQREVATDAGIPQPSLARWLSGARDVTTPFAEKVMGALGLRVTGAPRTRKPPG